MMEMHGALSGELGTGVGLMNTSGTNILSGGLGPLGMGLGVGEFRVGLPESDASFKGLSSGTGLDGVGAASVGEWGKQTERGRDGWDVSS